MPGSERVDSLVLDLLEWIDGEQRPYGDVLEVVSISAGGAHYLRTRRRRSP